MGKKQTRKRATLDVYDFWHFGRNNIKSAKLKTEARTRHKPKHNLPNLKVPVKIVQKLRL